MILEKKTHYMDYIYLKKSFGGHVVELIGEFDLIISPFWYHTYNLAFKTYHSLKSIKTN